MTGEIATARTANRLDGFMFASVTISAMVCQVENSRGRQPQLNS